MSSAEVNYYQDKFTEWFDRWQALPKWRLYKRAIAWGRWRFYLEMMSDTIAIENYERKRGTWVVEEPVSSEGITHESGHK